MGFWGSCRNCATLGQTKTESLSDFYTGGFPGISSSLAEIMIRDQVEDSASPTLSENEQHNDTCWRIIGSSYIYNVYNLNEKLYVN